MNPTIKIEMEQGGIMTFELLPEVAPLSVANFLDLIAQKFYDGLIFHRVIAGFMIQGGCPIGNGSGGPEYGIVGEFESNTIPNVLLHEAGVISMARSGDPNSAGSQFFIMHKNAPHLDGNYAAFGRIIEGQQVVDAIAECETDPRDRPEMAQIIKTITVETHGVNYPEPVKI